MSRDSCAFFEVLPLDVLDPRAVRVHGVQRTLDIESHHGGSAVGSRFGRSPLRVGTGDPALVLVEERQRQGDAEHNAIRSEVVLVPASHGDVGRAEGPLQPGGGLGLDLFPPGREDIRACLECLNDEPWCRRSVAGLGRQRVWSLSRGRLQSVGQLERLVQPWSVQERQQGAPRVLH